MLTVISEPEKARIFANWEPFGETTQTLDRNSVGGLLVVTKPGFLAGYRNLDAEVDDTLHFTLVPDTSWALITLLRARGAVDSQVIRELVHALEDVGLIARSAPPDFLQQTERTADVLNAGFMGWARARYGARFLVNLDAEQVVRDMSEQPVSDAVRQALRGMFKADLHFSADVIDLRDGKQLGTIEVRSTGSGLDESRAIQRALEEAGPTFAERVAALAAIEKERASSNG